MNEMAMLIRNQLIYLSLNNTDTGDLGDHYNTAGKSHVQTQENFIMYRYLYLLPTTYYLHARQVTKQHEINIGRYVGI